MVDKAELWGEPAAVTDFPSGTRALYAGFVDAATGTGTYDDQGNAVDIEIETTIYSAPATGYVRISFKYFREVEQYALGEYDITEVLIRDPSGGHADVIIWRKTSKDPNEGSWTSFVSEPQNITYGFKVVFRFRTVDALNNDHLGWLIDDLRVEEVPPPLEVSVEINEPGEVGKPYTTDTTTTPEDEPNIELRATGGTPPYSWSVVEGYELPSRLSLQPSDTNNEYCYIVGTPEAPGYYFVKIIVEDDEENSAIAEFHIRIKPAAGTYTVITEELGGLEGGLPSGWSKEPGNSLWHLSEIQTPSRPAGDPKAIYYGKPTDHNYDTGRRTYGYAISPRWDVSSYRGNSVQILFAYWRQVESTTDGPFDQTFIEIRFDDGTWRRIWYKDSTEPSAAQWKTEVVDEFIDDTEIIVPNEAQTMQLRLGFDSVDSYENNYVGWLVDYIEIRFVPYSLQITTEGIPAAETGTFYSTTFEAIGGVPPYEWEVVSGRPPCGLVLDRHSGTLSGTVTCDPESYDFTIKVVDANSTEVTKGFTLQVNRKNTLFADSFEDQLASWDADGLWHATDAVKGVDLTGYGMVAYYGKDDATDPNYSTGARTTGAIVSPEFGLDGATAFKVEFDHWREVEYYSGGGYDVARVEVQFKQAGSWGDWYTVWSEDSATPSQRDWTHVETDPFAVPSGATHMRIRFVFDSVDRYYNNFVGWLVDNVKVSKAEDGETLSASSAVSPARARGFDVFNYPNPITDVHTTTFVVRGVEAERIRIEIYDLSGRLVWQGEAPGPELTWHTEDLAGRYLANGVYLYVAYVKVGDTWIRSEIKKLAIYR